MEPISISPELRLGILARLASRRPASADANGDVEGRLLSAGDQLDGRRSDSPPASHDSQRLELLGALLEGRLIASERARVMEWLANDPDYYAAYIELAIISADPESSCGSD